MNKEYTKHLISVMNFYNLVQSDKIEVLLRDLKNNFNVDQVTAIEDFVFKLDENLSLLSFDEFYEYLQTKS